MQVLALTLASCKQIRNGEVMKRIAVFLYLVILQCPLTQAAVTIDFVDGAAGVRATASGSLNIDGLVFRNQQLTTTGYVRGSGALSAFDGWTAIGTGDIDAYNIDTSVKFSTGGNFLASSNSGRPVGIYSTTTVGIDTLYVPRGYVSGGALASTAIWAGETIASMGLIPGSHVISWGSGDNADTVTINIGPIAPPPPQEPTTYYYRGQAFTSATTGTYTTGMRVTGSITTSGPIPPNSTNFDIREIVSSWSFSDGVQTLTSSNGVFHNLPVFSPKFTTNANGDITLADVFVTNNPTATAVGQTNNYIATVQSAVFDHGALGARCQTISEGLCASYLFAARGFVNGALGTWTKELIVPAPPTINFTGLLPSATMGALNFTTIDPGCTFATPPKFLPESAAQPPLPDSVVAVDGLLDFEISGCAPGASVTVSMDYGTTLPTDTAFWKQGNPWYEISSSVSGSVIQYTLTDGGPNDADGVVNGRILDPGAAVVPAPLDTGGPSPAPPPNPGATAAPATPVPALPIWALILLSALLGFRARRSMRFLQ